MRIEDMKGTISIGSFKVPAIARIEHTQEQAEAMKRNLDELRRAIFGTHPVTYASGSLTAEECGRLADRVYEHERQEEQQIWTGLEFVPFSEVYRMLANVEWSFKYHERCRRLGKCLARKSRRYHVHSHRRLISQKRLAIVREKYA